MPFGWSFLSIAKVPMTWTPGDVWEAEVMLPAGSRTEYKFTILEEQVREAAALPRARVLPVFAGGVHAAGRQPHGVQVTTAAFLCSPRM